MPSQTERVQDANNKE